MSTKREREMLDAITRAEEAEMAAGEDDADETIYVRPRSPKEPTQVYSIRLPVSRVEQLRALAEARGVEPTVLVREWIVDRLAQEEVLAGSVRGLSPREFDVLEYLTLFHRHARMPDVNMVMGQVSDGISLNQVFGPPIIVGPDVLDASTRKELNAAVIDGVNWFRKRLDDDDDHDDEAVIDRRARA